MKNCYQQVDFSYIFFYSFLVVGGSKCRHNYKKKIFLSAPPGIFKTFKTDSNFPIKMALGYSHYCLGVIFKPYGILQTLAHNNKIKRFDFHNLHIV